MQKITSAYANKMLRSLEFRKVLPMVETMTNTGVPSVRPIPAGGRTELMEW